MLSEEPRPVILLVMAVYPRMACNVLAFDSTTWYYSAALRGVVVLEIGVHIKGAW